jgi:hypothetical protein
VEQAHTFEIGRFSPVLSTVRVDVLQPNDECQRDDHPASGHSRDISIDAMGLSGAVCAIPRSICASLRHDDGVHYETRGNGTAPAGVAALGAANVDPSMSLKPPDKVCSRWGP